MSDKELITDGPLAPLPHGKYAVEISVVIVSWNARSFLEECLESLEQPSKCSLEVIVVDNASSDGSPEMVAARFPSVVLIQTGANLGFSKGNNVGIRRSRGKYLALINSDARVLPGCLDRLAEFLDEHEDVGMVGPRVMYGDMTLQSSCRRFPGVWNNFCEVFRLNKIFPSSEYFAGEHMFYFGYNRTREVEVLVGCFILARRSAVEQFGLLDEDFWMYGEDLDWSRRCRNAGWKVIFYPDAEAVHHCGGSSANDPDRFLQAQQKARVLLWKKHHTPLKRLALISLASIHFGMRLARSIMTLAIQPASRSRNLERLALEVRCLKELWKSDHPLELAS